MDCATHNRIMDNLVPQQGNSGAGVKLTDTSNPGTSIELDRAFSELMTSGALSGYFEVNAKPGCCPFHARISAV